MEHLVQHMMYIHLLEQGLLQWEPLVLLMCWLSVEADQVATVQAAAVALAECLSLPIRIFLLAHIVLSSVREQQRPHSVQAVTVLPPGLARTSLPAEVAGADTAPALRALDALAGRVVAVPDREYRRLAPGLERPVKVMTAATANRILPAHKAAAEAELARRVRCTNLALVALVVLDFLTLTRGLRLPTLAVVVVDRVMVRVALAVQVVVALAVLVLDQRLLLEPQILVVVAAVRVPLVQLRQLLAQVAVA